MKQILPTLTLPPGFNKVLLHSCCAPCVCEIMETLKRSSIDATIFFYNPNIDTENEYNKRKIENIEFAKRLNIPFIDGDYDIVRWESAVSGYEHEPERGKRCTLCFEMRLTAAAQYAFNNNFQLFTSSLGISRWKNFYQVTNCGSRAADKFSGITYWDYNWRKKGGSDRKEKIIKRENFYRQNYCGCIYSKG